jgi:hypothetical protein
MRTESQILDPNFLTRRFEGTSISTREKVKRALEQTEATAMSEGELEGREHAKTHDARA